MSLNFLKSIPKELIFENIAEYLHLKNLKINKQDNTRPWGGYFVLEETETEKFIKLYFQHLIKEELYISGKLSPQILVVTQIKD